MSVPQSWIQKVMLPAVDNTSMSITTQSVVQVLHIYGGVSNISTRGPLDVHSPMNVHVYSNDVCTLAYCPHEHPLIVHNPLL